MIQHDHVCAKRGSEARREKTEGDSSAGRKRSSIAKALEQNNLCVDLLCTSSCSMDAQELITRNKRALVGMAGVIESIRRVLAGVIEEGQSDSIGGNPRRILCQPAPKIDPYCHGSSDEPSVFGHYLTVDTPSDGSESEDFDLLGYDELNLYSACAVSNLAFAYHHLGLVSPADISYIIKANQLYHLALRLCSGQQSSIELVWIQTMALNNILTISRSQQVTQDRLGAVFQSPYDWQQLTCRLLSTLRSVMSSVSSLSSPPKEIYQDGNDSFSSTTVSANTATFFSSCDLQQLALNILLFQRECSQSIAGAA